MVPVNLFDLRTLSAQMRQKSSTPVHHGAMSFERSFDCGSEEHAIGMAGTELAMDLEADDEEDEMRSFETLMSGMFKERAQVIASTHRCVACMAFTLLTLAPVLLITNALPDVCWSLRFLSVISRGPSADGRSRQAQNGRGFDNAIHAGGRLHSFHVECECMKC
jgi:hypothetical protein